MKKPLSKRTVLIGDIVLCILAFAAFTFMTYITVGAGA